MKYNLDMILCYFVYIFGKCNCTWTIRSFFNVYKKIINAFLSYKKYIKLGFFTLNKLEIEK